MTCSLIITTYNWKEALELIFISILNQTILPEEIIIADDGSRDDTKELIEKYSKIFKIPLIHSWQTDDGFRAAMSRNKAISKSSCDYIIVIDGDMILHPNFIKDHKKFAKKECFIQGSRVLLGENRSTELFKNKNLDISFFDNDIRNRINSIYSDFLADIFLKKTKSLKGIKTCNMSFYLNDCIKVNGFNEDFKGWGREDSEFIARFFNNDLKRQNVKFNAIAFHIWHNENSRKDLLKNDEILNYTIKNNIKFCKNGLDKYK